jgi:hypothetical protein
MESERSDMSESAALVIKANMSESAEGIRTDGAGILESWKKRFLAVGYGTWIAPLAN